MECAPAGGQLSAWIMNKEDIKLRTVYNLNAKWAFTKMATEVPTELPKLWDWVNLPHSWNAIDGQDGGNDYHRGTCYYAKSVNKFEKSL